MTLFELMDVEAGGVVGFYPSEDAALAVVRQSLERYGPASVLPLALSGGTDLEMTDLIAAGEELLKLVRGGFITRVVLPSASQRTQVSGAAGLEMAHVTLTGGGIRRLTGANWLRTAFGQPSRAEPRSIGYSR